VDDCIRVERKRVSGEVESFSKPKEFLVLQNRINNDRRLERILEVFPTTKDYLKYVKRRKPKKKKKRWQVVLLLSKNPPYI